MGTRLEKISDALTYRGRRAPGGYVDCDGGDTAASGKCYDCVFIGHPMYPNPNKTCCYLLAERGMGKREISDYQKQNDASCEYYCPNCSAPVEEEGIRDEVLRIAKARGFYEHFDWGPVPEKKIVATPRNEGCFIATAVYGDYDHPKVLALRDFRDRVLAKRSTGRAIISAYYVHSPRIAAYLKKKPVLAATVRIPVSAASFLAETLTRILGR